MAPLLTEAPQTRGGFSFVFRAKLCWMGLCWGINGSRAFRDAPGSEGSRIYVMRWKPSLDPEGGQAAFGEALFRHVLKNLIAQLN